MSWDEVQLALNSTALSKTEPLIPLDKLIKKNQATEIIVPGNKNTKNIISAEIIFSKPQYKTKVIGNFKVDKAGLYKADTKLGISNNNGIRHLYVSTEANSVNNNTIEKNFLYDFMIGQYENANYTLVSKNIFLKPGMTYYLHLSLVNGGDYTIKCNQFKLLYNIEIGGLKGTVKLIQYVNFPDEKEIEITPVDDSKTIFIPKTFTADSVITLVRPGAVKGTGEWQIIEFW